MGLGLAGVAFMAVFSLLGQSLSMQAHVQALANPIENDSRCVYQREEDQKVIIHFQGIGAVFEKGHTYGKVQIRQMAIAIARPPPRPRKNLAPNSRGRTFWHKKLPRPPPCHYLKE